MKLRFPRKKNKEIDEEFRIYYEKPSATWKRILRSVFPFFNLGIAGLVIWWSMSRGDYEPGEALAVNINFWWIVLGFAVYYAAELIECLRSYFVMRTTVDKKNFTLVSKNYLLSKHYDALTPFSGGGKPYQLYYLHKNGLNFGQTTTMMVSNFIIGRIGFQIATGIPLLLLISRFGELGGYGVVLSAVILGIIFNVGLTVFLVIVAFSKKIPQIVTSWGIWLFAKLRIIKDKQKVGKAMDESLWQYRVTMRRLLKKPLLLLGFVAMSTVATFLHVFVIVFVYLAVGGNDPAHIPLLLLGIVLTWYTALSTPIPGGTGALELFFIAIFATVIPSPHIFIAVAIYRVFSYVLPIVNGVPIVLWDAYRDRRKRILSK